MFIQGYAAEIRLGQVYFHVVYTSLRDIVYFLSFFLMWNIFLLIDQLTFVVRNLDRLWRDMVLMYLL